MFDLIQVVGIKAPVDLFDQLGGRLHVDVRGVDIDMAHIGCQVRKPGVNIVSVSIPGQQPVNRKGMSEVVDAGAGVCAVMDTALPEHMPEGLINGRLVQGSGSLVDEERRVGRAWPYLQACVHVSLKGSAGRRAQGRPAGLSELAFGYVEAPLGVVEVLQVQGQRLTDPDSRAVEKSQKRLVGVRPKRVFGGQLRGGLKERLDLGVAIDIGLMSPCGRDAFQGFGHIAERIAPGQVLAQLSDYTEAIGAGAWGKL